MMIQELNEMQRMAGASALALELQTKKNQQLQHQITLMQNSIDVLTDQRTTAEGQIKRLLDLLERTQAQLDAAMAIVNVARQSRGRLVWAFKRMKQAAKHWSEAHSRELKAHYDSVVVIMAVRNTVAAWEKLCSCVDEFGAGSEYCGEQADVVDKRIIEMRTALATFDATRGTK